MGGTELEATTTTQPEGVEQLAEEDVEIDVVMDLTLEWPPARMLSDAELEATPLAMCQICMEFFGSQEIVREVCGPECIAEVCDACLVQHLTASAFSYYAGVLPKIRCPVCLTLMNKAQWTGYVVADPPAAEGEDGAEEEEVWDNSHVVDKYEILCRQSCGFQSPCCHNVEYTMLPVVSSTGDSKREIVIKVPRSLAPDVDALVHRFQQFNQHRIEAAELYDFLMDRFEAEAEEIFNAMLRHILDDERRATLLLHHLHKNPDTFTTCCKCRVCFKCKAAVHHDGDCGDFVEDESLLDCPGCRVTLVKVDGCDSVTCLCGYAIHWPEAVEKQRLQRKHLAPTDEREYRRWSRWSQELRSCLHQIESLDVTWRELRLGKLIREHRGALRVLLHKSLRLARLNLFIQRHRNQLRELLQKRRRLSQEKGPASIMLPSCPESSSPLPVAPAA